MIAETIRRPRSIAPTSCRAARPRSLDPPPGWLLSPRMVETFILGPASSLPPRTVPFTITPKFVGDRRLVAGCDRDARLGPGADAAGEPGTPRAWLSEHLAAGDLRYVAARRSGYRRNDRGADQVLLELRVSSSPRAQPGGRWSRARFCAGCNADKLVRFEELTRCAAEVQDALISILSEKQVAIPELDEIVRRRAASPSSPRRTPATAA